MKAVIMAGGEGSRLRPLTCDMPKPMAPICGRPVMDYTLELLARNGFDEAAVTLMYMPQMITEYFGESAHGIKLKYYIEDTPLGTAGSVKAASKDFHEDFLVISGDGLCDFDLKMIMDFHRKKGGMATIVLKGMPNPLEYGLVITEDDGRVLRFLEKPDWNQALTDLVNTGVYVLSTECMKLIPEGKAFDFGKELFPILLKNKVPIYGYREKGYWLDIGDISTYISGQFDLLDGKIKFDIDKKRTKCEGAQGPVWIGENVSIGRGAKIGEYAIIGDGCKIAEGASVRNSVVGAGSYIGKRASLRGALVCGNCVVKADSAMYDGSVLGMGSVLSEGSVVSPNVRIWPSKKIEANIGVYYDVVAGNSGGGLIENGMIRGVVGADITPEYAVRIGSAAATALKGGKIAVAYDGCEGGGIIKTALIAGLRGSGAEVTDMGALPTNVFSFGVVDRNNKLGLIVTDNGIVIRDEFGLAPSREVVRKIESAYRRGEFSRSGYRDSLTDTVVTADYLKRIERYRTEKGSGISVDSPQSVYSKLISSILPRGNNVRVDIDANGETASIVDEEGNKIDQNRILFGIAMLLLENGETEISLPPNIPNSVFDAVMRLGSRTTRRIACPHDSSDSAARKLASKQRVLDDAVEGLTFLLSTVAERGEKVADFFKRVPQFYVSEITEECVDFNGGMIIRIFREREKDCGYAEDGVGLKSRGGVCYLRPSDRGKSIRITAEADNMETAEEFCFEVLDKLRNIKNDLTKTYGNDNI